MLKLGVFMRVSCLLFSLVLTACAGMHSSSSAQAHETAAADELWAQLDQTVELDALVQPTQSVKGGTPVQTEESRCRGALLSCSASNGWCSTQFYPRGYTISSQYPDFRLLPENRKQLILVHFQGETRSNEHHTFEAREVRFRFLEDEDLLRACDSSRQVFEHEEEGYNVTVNLPLSAYPDFMENVERHAGHLRFRLAFPSGTASSIRTYIESGVHFAQ